MNDGLSARVHRPSRARGFPSFLLVAVILADCTTDPVHLGNDFEAPISTGGSGGAGGAGGTSATSGTGGADAGTAGTTGTAGTAAGASGGANGASGTSGFGGTSGASGIGGTSGSAGTAGTMSGAPCGGPANPATCAPDAYCEFAPSAACSTGPAGVCTSRPESCPACTGAPEICGCDGARYCSACDANLAGVDVDPSGVACPDGGPHHCGVWLGPTCEASQVCIYDDDDCGQQGNVGTCLDRPDPANCDSQCNPICGCDGMVYCNECLANLAGVDALPTPTCP